MTTQIMTQEILGHGIYETALRTKLAHPPALSKSVLLYLSMLQRLSDSVNETLIESLSLLAVANNDEFKGFIETRIQSAKDRNTDSTLKYKDFTASVLLGTLLPPQYVGQYAFLNIELYETLETTKAIIEGLKKTFGDDLYTKTKLGQLLQEKMDKCMPRIIEYQSSIRVKLNKLAVAEADRKNTGLPLDYPNLFYDVELQEFVTSQISFDTTLSGSTSR